MHSGNLPPLPPSFGKLPADYFDTRDLETIVPPEEMDAKLITMINKVLPLLADRDPTKPIYFCGVMQGGINSGVRFRQLFPLPLTDIYAHVSSYKYAEKPGPLEWVVEPNAPMEGCHVIVFDDVKDSGESVAAVKAHCENRGAKVITCTTTDKVFKHPYTIIIDAENNITVPAADNTDGKSHVYGVNIGNVYLGGDGLDLAIGEKPNQRKVFRNIRGIFGVRPKDKNREEKYESDDITDLTENTLISPKQLDGYSYTPSILPYFDQTRLNYYKENNLAPVVPFETLDQGYLTTAIQITMVLQDKLPLVIYLVDQAIDFAIPLMEMLNFPIEQDYVEFVRDDKEEASAPYHFIQKPHFKLEGRTVLVMDKFIGEGNRLKALVGELAALGDDKTNIFTAVLGDKKFKRANGPNKDFNPHFCVQEITSDVELVGHARDKVSAKNFLGPGIFKRVKQPKLTEILNTTTAPTSAL